jgi:hypothetical protein
VLELRPLFLVELAVKVTLNHQTLWLVRSTLLWLNLLDKVVVIHIQDFHVVVLSCWSLSLGLLLFIKHVAGGGGDLVSAADLYTLILSATAILLAGHLFSSRALLDGSGFSLFSSR